MTSSRPTNPVPGLRTAPVPPPETTQREEFISRGLSERAVLAAVLGVVPAESTRGELVEAIAKLMRDHEAMEHRRQVLVYGLYFELGGTPDNLDHPDVWAAVGRAIGWPTTLVRQWANPWTT